MGYDVNLFFAAGEMPAAREVLVAQGIPCRRGRYAGDVDWRYLVVAQGDDENKATSALIGAGWKDREFSGGDPGVEINPYWSFGARGAA